MLKAEVRLPSAEVGEANHPEAGLTVDKIQVFSAMPEKPKTEDEPPQKTTIDSAPADPDDPLGVRRTVTGIGLLILVCSILWAISYFGPAGANWFGDQTQKLFGVEPTVVEKEKGEVKSSPDSEQLPPPSNPAETRAQSSARDQLLEALGGPEKAVVRHIAISRDGESMVAAVRLLEPEGAKKNIEIIFEKDEFERYVSIPNSPIEQTIKIWNVDE